MKRPRLYAVWARLLLVINASFAPIPGSALGNTIESALPLPLSQSAASGWAAEPLTLLALSD